MVQSIERSLVLFLLNLTLLNEIKGSLSFILIRSVLGGFVDNHDTPRFLHFNPSHTGLKNELAFVIMGDWIPIVYYGTEQGFDGGKDPNNRESLWPYMSTENPLYIFIQTLTKFRRGLGNEWLQKKQVKEAEILLQLF